MISFSNLSPKITQECSICYSTLDKDVVGHKDGGQLHPFHRVCIDQWLQKHAAPQSCPMCNRAVKLPTNGLLILNTLSNSSNSLSFPVLASNHNEGELNSEMPNNWTINDIEELEL